jgi:hypothetical protein
MIRTISRILKLFADDGLFDEGVALIGSWCFWCYQRKLGARGIPLKTQDIDFLIPNPYGGRKHALFVDRLQALGFNRDFNSDGSLFLWNEEVKIEFITPEKGRGTDRAIRIDKLGISAIPLRFVSMLLDDPITVRDQGVDIRVPHPANFCLHKLLIASRRRKIEKSLKDLEQAICTAAVADGGELRTLFISLPAGWRRAILRVLERAGESLPLYDEEIAALRRTLQPASAKPS